MSYAIVNKPSVWGRSPVWRDMDRFFAPFGAPQARTDAWQPRIDVEKTEDGYTVSAELPGFAAEEFEVVVEEGSLTLKGAKTETVEKPAAEAEGEEAAVETRSWKEFSRRFRLGKDIDVDAVKASYKNGLLTVTLPRRAPESTARTIPVTAS